MIKYQKRVLEIGADVSKPGARPASRVPTVCSGWPTAGLWLLIGGYRLGRPASCSSAARCSDRLHARRAALVACACFDVVGDQKKESDWISSRYADADAALGGCARGQGFCAQGASASGHA